jgi:cytochrome c oxidase assembly protein subunit 11
MGKPSLLREDALHARNRSLMISLLGIVAGMVMLSYASVPLYSMFCRFTGYGGTPQISAKAPEAILARRVKVTFNTDISPDLPWEFVSLQKEVDTHIGKRNLIFFKATNVSNHAITATSTYNVTPFKVGEYFVKLQCFCFEKQTLQAGESMTFPVSFYVDPSLADDKNLDDVTNVTLSYTFFPVPE